LLTCLFKGHLPLRGPHTERELSGASKAILCPPNTVHPPRQSWTRSSFLPPGTTRSLAGPHRKCLFTPKNPFCSLFRPRSLLGPRSSSTVVPGPTPSSYHPTFPFASVVVLILQALFSSGLVKQLWLRAPIGAAVEDELEGVSAGESCLVRAGGSSDSARTGLVSGQVDRPYSFSTSRASASRYSSSSGKKKGNSRSRNSRPPSILPAYCECTHCAAPANTDATGKSQSISTVMEVALSRNASESTSRFVWTTCVVCPRFPLIFLAHLHYGPV
jgi:hypothetical protein